MIFFDAFTRFGVKPAMHPAQPYRLEHLVAQMRHCSISAALVSCTAQVQYDPLLENRRLLDKLKPFPFLFPVWVAMPHHTGEFPEPDAFAEQLRKENVRAVALYPKTHLWPLIGQTAKPLLDALERAGTLVILDQAFEVPTEQLQELLDRHPRLPVLARNVHWGQQRTIVPMLMRHKNLHITFDTFQINRGIERLTELGCEDQLVYGSNAVDMSMGHRLYVDYAMVSDTVKQKVACGNLVRLLRGLRPPAEIVNRDEDAIMSEARQGKPLSSLTIDFHSHILDHGVNGGGGNVSMYRGDAAGMLELAQRMGVDCAGVMSWNGTVGVQADDGNQCVRDALKVLPENWWGLATVDVLHETAESTTAKFEEIFRDKRFLGLKPYIQYGVPYDDKRYDAWWKFGNERKLYCGLHPVNWYKSGEFDGVCPRWPDMTVVGFHVAGTYPIADTAIELAKKYPNFMGEITLTPMWMGIIEYLVAGMGADRLLYGSDQPMRDPRPQLGWVVYSTLDYESKLKVLGQNAQRILDRVRAAQR